MPQRKTVDCWRFYVNYGYGHGQEHEITEYSRAAMKENRKAYQENCAYPLTIKRGRERVSDDYALARIRDAQATWCRCTHQHLPPLHRLNECGRTFPCFG